MSLSYNMELDYEKMFKLPLLAMRINRSDPAIKRNIKWIIPFIIMHGQTTIIFLVIMYNIFLNLKDDDFSQACKNGTLSIMYIEITFLYSIMLWKQPQLLELMNTMKNDYILAKSLPLEEQEIIYAFAKKGRHVCKQWMVISAIGVGLFPLKNIVLLTYYWIIGEFRLIPVYELEYPSFIEDRNDSLFMYAFIYFEFCFFGFYLSTMYAAFVPLGPSAMLHACGQLELATKRTRDLFKSHDIEEVRETFKGIVKHLQLNYDFVDLINLCFRVAYEITLKVTTVTCYEVLESLKKREVTLEFITFIVGGVLISSSPCFYSDLLMEKGVDLRLAMYSCGWEKVYDRGIRSTLLIVLQRALRPVAIRSLFRTVCLEALTDVVQQSYTIFNLMNAVWE